MQYVLLWVSFLVSFQMQVLHTRMLWFLPNILPSVEGVSSWLLSEMASFDPMKPFNEHKYIFFFKNYK